MRTIVLKSIPVAISLMLANAANAQIKIGVAGPITGANATFGSQLTQGVEQAAEDIIKAGGILGQKIEVEPGDDVSDPKRGCRWPTNSSATASSSSRSSPRSSRRAPTI